MHSLPPTPDFGILSVGGGGSLFPAGVELDSPSRDASNWLSTRFSRSVETRRRFGCLRIDGVHPVRASSKLQFGSLGEEVARERQGTGHCRGEPGRAPQLAASVPWRTLSHE